MNLRELILNNFWYKVFSLVLALLIWVVIETNFTAGNVDVHLPTNPLRADVTRDFRRPVILMTSAGNQHVFRVEPAEVSVKVRGDAGQMQALLPDDIQVVVDLVNVPEPRGSFRLLVNAPREVIVQQVWPAHVQVLPTTNPVARPPKLSSTTETP